MAKLNHPHLPAMDVAARLGRLRERLEPGGLDGLLVTNLTNLRYLTGFSGSAGMLVVTRSEALFVTDGRYREQASTEASSVGVEVGVAVGEMDAQIVAIDRVCKGLRRLGLEAEAVSWGMKLRLEASLGAFSAAGGELVATEGLIEELRRVKDVGELARIERAADIADVALAQAKHRLTEDLSEAEFAIELEHEMRQRGADDVSFSTIVGSGPNGSLPHASPSERRIVPGDVIVVDFGALVDGYHSDMTRTFSVGTPSSNELVDIADAVLMSQRAGVRALRPGASGAEVDAACRESLERDGYGELFVHGTGHGVGLDIHEAPRVRKGSPDILEEGEVVTVEPGVYVPGLGGVRIEDTLVVTDSGARPLTKSTKDTIL